MTVGLRMTTAGWAVLLLTATAVGVVADDGETWRGLVVAAEVECTDYAPANFRHSQSVEKKIADSLGGWWSPYDGTEFSNQESDIEHIVAKSEARDSGLCGASAEMQKRFTNDMDNLTLATDTLNSKKGAKDAAGWRPEHNRRWFAGRVLAVKLEYGLTVDPPERDWLEDMLEGCRIEDVRLPYRPPPPEAAVAAALDTLVAELGPAQV